MKYKEPQSDSWQRGQIVSLFDMITQFRLLRICNNWESLREIDRLLDDFIQRSGRDALPSDEIQFEITSRVDVWKSEPIEWDIAPIIGRLNEADEAVACGFLSAKNVSDVWKGLAAVYCHCLREPIFLCLSDDNKKHFIDDIVPESVRVALPGCVPDLLEANKCFAVGRYGGTQYHAMIALGPVLQWMADKIEFLKGSYEETIKTDDCWEIVLKRVQSELTRLKEAGGRRHHGEQIARLGDLTKFMWGVKEANRDKIMHIPGEYQEGRARDLLMSVDIFLRYMSEHEIEHKDTE